MSELSSVMILRLR